MTREEWAIKIIKAECYVFNPLNLDRTQMVNTALDMAIRSLEAWEKVKAEIKDIKDLYDLGKDDVSTKMFLEGVETVEQIIDKYKVESEVQDADSD